jgi:cation-transporting ATPase 13A3/4/5
LYWIATNLADFQFLYIDLFLATILAVTFGFTAAAREVSPFPAPQRMLSLKSILSIVAQMIVIGAFQVFIFRFTPLQVWFTPFTFPGDVNDYDSYQGTSVFQLSLYQYIALILVYSKSYPHRRTVLSNPWLMGWLAVSLSVSIWITLDPPGFLKMLLILKMPPPMGYRYFILLLGILNMMVMILTEEYLIEVALRIAMRVIRQKVRFLRKQPPPYRQIWEEIKHNPQTILSESNSIQHDMRL